MMDMANPPKKARAAQEGFRPSMKIASSLIVTITLLSHTAVAEDAGCKGNARLIGKCYMVRGFVIMSADIGPVLDTDRTHGRLIIRAAPYSEKDMPPSVGNLLSDNITAEIHGTYEVCPIPVLPSQFPPESTRFVCVNSASRVSISGFSPPKN
jgi:hypothetical protein